MDTMTRKKRSELMSRIRGDRLGPETRLDDAMSDPTFPHRHAYERNVAWLPGRPDFVFFGRKLAVFVDGCFWHGCAEHFRLPKARRAWWRGKIDGNRRRDRRVRRQLRLRGYRTMSVWEHELRGRDGLRRAVARIERRLSR